MQQVDPQGTDSVPNRNRTRRGQLAYRSGMAAEESVARLYAADGARCAARRWRGQGGEIDLIFRDGAVFVFVEVKKARNSEAAIARLSEAQMWRIHAAASEYLGTTPEGQLSEVRFDLALVDERGAVRLMKDAFGHF